MMSFPTLQRLAYCTIRAFQKLAQSLPMRKTRAVGSI
jgi:hypothetical protein